MTPIDRVHLVTTRSLSYTSPAGVTPDLPDASEILGRASRENFTVASLALPAPSRRHLMAFYGYARLVDQVGDAYPGDRRAALDRLDAEVGAALSGEGKPVHTLVAEAVTSLHELGADPQPLFDLIAANRMDQDVHSYETFGELVGYCRLSANPVGRLVLAAFGASTPERVAWSDSICTGLQITEHCQDVREDALAGRVYLPSEDLRRFGVDPASLTQAGPSSPAVKALLAFQVARARRWLDDGLPLVDSLRGRPRWAVAGFWAGGQAALDAIADRDFDVFADPEAVHPSKTGVFRRLIPAVRGRA